MSDMINCTFLQYATKNIAKLEKIMSNTLLKSQSFTQLARVTWLIAHSCNKQLKILRKRSRLSPICFLSPKFYSTDMKGIINGTLLQNAIKNIAKNIRLCPIYARSLVCKILIDLIFVCILLVFGAPYGQSTNEIRTQIKSI